MASASSSHRTTSTTSLHEPIFTDDDDYDDDKAQLMLEEEQFDDDEEEEEWGMSRRMSRLSIEAAGSDGGDDGDAEPSENEQDKDNIKKTSVGDEDASTGAWEAGSKGRLWVASMPGTPDHFRPPLTSTKEYASETELAERGSKMLGGRSRRRRRKRGVRERAWQQQLPSPCDFTVEVEIPYPLSGADTPSSGGNSPSSTSWRISSPGDDPNDVKARLKVWAQAVAQASASRLSG